MKRSYLIYTCLALLAFSFPGISRGEGFDKAQLINAVKNRQAEFNSENGILDMKRARIGQQIDRLVSAHSQNPSDVTLQQINELKNQLLEISADQLRNYGRYIQFLEQALFDVINQP